MLNLLTKNTGELDKIVYGKKKTLKRPTPKRLHVNHKKKDYREVASRNQSVD